MSLEIILHYGYSMKQMLKIMSVKQILRTFPILQMLGLLYWMGRVNPMVQSLVPRHFGWGPQVVCTNFPY